MLLVIVKQSNICYLPTPAVAGATTKVDRGATTWSGCFSQQSPSFFPSGGQTAAVSRHRAVTYLRAGFSPGGASVPSEQPR